MLLDEQKFSLALGNSIYNLRKSKGYSQEKLAELTGLHRTYISDIERGAKNVTVKKVALICFALNVPLSILFKEVDKEYESMDIDVKDLELENLLYYPEIVDKGYWSRGYFYNIGKQIEIPDDLDYGFYSIGKECYVDEYKNRISRRPKLLGIYGVATGTGVAYYINRELILKGRI